MHLTPEEAEDRIADYYTGNCTDEETRELEEWIAQSADHQREFERVMSQCHSIYRTEADRVGERMGERIADGMSWRMGRRKRLRRARAATVAACIAVAVVAVWLFANPDGERRDGSFADGTLPGSRGSLQVGDRETISLDGAGDALSGNFNVVVDADGMTFLPDTSTRNEIKMLAVDIARGGEYRLTLEDGTRVVMNSASRVRFPERFDAERREIEVSGEVYLEVARDTERPFVIRSGDFSVEVLGTTFGIRNYADEADKTVTLVSGRVRVERRGECVVLEPGWQAVVSAERMGRREADVAQELAWVDGMFVFDNEPLRSVLSRLSKWYDVRFDLSNPALGGEPFTGRMERSLGVDAILGLIGRLDIVEFILEDDTYVVREKKQNRND